MRQDVKPGFSKEYANKKSKAEFVEHFKEVYPTVDLESEWERLQDAKKEPVKEEKPKAK